MSVARTEVPAAPKSVTCPLWPRTSDRLGPKTPRLPRLDEVAGPGRNEVAVDRASGKTRSKAQASEASHGTCCDRSRRKGIPGVRAVGTGSNPGGKTVADPTVERLPGATPTESGGRGDVRR